MVLYLLGFIYLILFLYIIVSSIIAIIFLRINNLKYVEVVCFRFVPFNFEKNI